MNRRSFMASILAAAVAPAFVRYGSLMVPKAHGEITTELFKTHIFPIEPAGPSPLLRLVGRPVMFQDAARYLSMGSIIAYNPTTGKLSVSDGAIEPGHLVKVLDMDPRDLIVL